MQYATELFIKNYTFDSKKWFSSNFNVQLTSRFDCIGLFGVALMQRYVRNNPLNEIVTDLEFLLFAMKHEILCALAYICPRRSTRSISMGISRANHDESI